MPEETNLFERKLEEQPVTEPRVMHSSDFLPGIVHQRNIKAPFKMVEFSTSRPDGSSDVKAHFNTSSGVLSMWDGTQWLSTTLS